MGFFKDVRSLIKSADSNAASARRQAATYRNVAFGEVSDFPDSIAWEPIEGITLDRYARLTADMVRLQVFGTKAVHNYVRNRGVKPEVWDHIVSEWTGRMVRYPYVRARYGSVFSREMSE